MSDGVRVLTLFVRAGTATYPESEARLADLFARQFPAVRRDVLVVDNLLPRGVAESAPGRTVIGGDNRAWEFSAFDVAVAHLGEAIWQYDLVNLVTSAFEQLYVAYLERFTPAVLAAVAGQRVCLGHIDCYNEAVEVLGISTQHWARTSFLMLPPAELRLLGSLVSVQQRQPWFSGQPDAPFSASAPLSERYQRYILDWLLGGDIGQGVQWHRSLTLDAAGLDAFEQKARTLLNEMLLGVRLRAAGCRVVDVTWLSSQQAAGAPIDWDTPWWEQLAGRDRDALRIEMPAVASVAASPQLATVPEPVAPAVHDVNAAYDIQTIEVMRRVLRDDSVCLDIGAHEGSVLCEMVALAPHGRHHAFEPLPHLAAHLRQTYPGVRVHDTAVSDAPGRAQYVYVENAPTYSGLRERDYDRPDPQKTLLDVVVTRIDDVVGPDETIAFIKLDIEGGEYHALRGAGATIRRCRPIIVFEANVRSTGRYGVLPDDMFGMIARDYGYHLSTMQRWLTGEAPFSAAEFARNWNQGPEYYFIAYPAEVVGGA